MSISGTSLRSTRSSLARAIADEIHLSETDTSETDELTRFLDLHSQT